MQNVIELVRLAPEAQAEYDRLLQAAVADFAAEGHAVDPDCVPETQAVLRPDGCVEFATIIPVYRIVEYTAQPGQWEWKPGQN